MLNNYRTKVLNVLYESAYINMVYQINVSTTTERTNDRYDIHLSIKH